MSAEILDRFAVIYRLDESGGDAADFLKVLGGNEVVLLAELGKGIVEPILKLIRHVKGFGFVLYRTTATGADSLGGGCLVLVITSKKDVNGVIPGVDMTEAMNKIKYVIEHITSPR